MSKADTKVKRKKPKEDTKNVEMEKIRSKLKSYKELLDAGKTLPRGLTDDLHSSQNSDDYDQVAAMFLEYKVLELYKKTLEPANADIWKGETENFITEWHAVAAIFTFVQRSTTFAQRLVELGFVELFLSKLAEPKCIEEQKTNQLMLQVVGYYLVIVESCVNSVTNHSRYKAINFKAALKSYLSSSQASLRRPAVKVLSAVSNEDECKKILDGELEHIKTKMQWYHVLYEADMPLPEGTEDDFFSVYLDELKYKVKVGEMMVKFKLPEVYKKTLDSVTSDMWINKSPNWDSCYYAISNLFSLSDNSKLLAEKLVELGYIQLFVKILNDPTYLQKYNTNSELQQVLQNVMGALANVIRQVPGHSVYREHNIVQMLKPYLSTNIMSLRTTAVMMLSALISESENSKLDDTGCIPFMVSGINSALKEKSRRFVAGDVRFGIGEILDCINRIAANDVNKIKLVEAGLLPDLVTCMQTGDHQEQELAAKLTWTLCFDKNVKEKVINEPGFLSALEKLTKSKDKDVQRAAKGALWKISGEQKHQKHIQRKSASKDNHKHIFISYQWDNQEIILQINNRLKRDGYKVWIDVEQMGGSTLESMAKGIENASLVLVCASEKYKLSPNCRTEAEYTFQTKKPLVPLMMQRRYRADGWLGMLMGAKLYVNFDGKYEFEEAYQMLVKEMTPYLKQKDNEDVTDGASIVAETASELHSAFAAPKTASSREPMTASWSHKQVLEWAKKYNLIQLNVKFQSLLESMDGQYLVEFCAMKREMPETFYKLATEKYGLDTLQYLRLRTAISHIRKHQMPETFYKLATEKYGLDTLQYLRLRTAISHIHKQ